MGAWRVAPAVWRTGLAAAVGIVAALPARAASTPEPSTAPLAPSRQAPAVPVTVSVLLDRPLRRFTPARTLGAALDGHRAGETAQIYTGSNLHQMAAAGLGSVAYRLRTELGVEAWHIGSQGRWSDPRRHAGYWTASASPSDSLSVSWGYALPRRGNTVDQAADVGYSRLDDGNPSSFWKSDPYLASHYTRESDARHPQWVLIDLGKWRAVDALRIDWATPFATRFVVQAYVGGNAVEMGSGNWRGFPRARFVGHGATQTVTLAARPVRVRFVRVLMTTSSHTALRGSHDLRDRLGYAIRELYLGPLGPTGRLRDLIVHRAARSQTRIYTSSTDPWHTAADRDRNYEQPSIQTVLHSGLTRRAPVLVPVSVLYGTPADAVAELRYMRALHLPLRGAELGEEPDGQLISPEDYGALYLQFARAIHHAYPRLPLGGPGLQTSLPYWVYWPNAAGELSWVRRFVAYLRAHDAYRQLNFFSFEWYPFDNVCAPPGRQLAENAALLAGVLNRVRRDGISARRPVYVTEYGYSAFAGQAEADLPGALLDADTVGTLIEAGVGAAYLYGYEPDMLLRESQACDSWGSLTLLQSDEQHHAEHRLASFWETQMLTRDWAQPGDAQHVLYTVRAHTTGREGGLVRTYAVRRPDGRLAVLALNLSPAQPVSVRVLLRSGGNTRAPGVQQEWQMSAATYRWMARGPLGRPTLDLPPRERTLSLRTRAVRLPPYSITVLRTVAALKPAR
jgi:F5/8 type C domain-containing protein